MNTENSFIVGHSITGGTSGDSFIRLSDSVLNHIDHSYVSSDGVEAIRDWVLEQIKALGKAPLYEHKCLSCGGTVELDYDKAIFICPYCGSHYAINTERVNDRG